MGKSFIKNKPAINMTLAGFGQAGGRMVDEFAKYQDSDGKQVYQCLALNSNDGDLRGLKYIDFANRISLGLGGLGKNPEKAMKILEENEKARDTLKEFIHEKVRPQDDLVLFFAGLGGGTGTSTIIKAIEEFYDFQNKPKIKEELAKLIHAEGAEAFKDNQNDFINRAVKAAKERYVKIGVIASLPLRSDGPDVLRQVNDFAQQIWKLANDNSKGIAFVMFPDNQFFYDEFKQLSTAEKSRIDNYRDYANQQIAETIHEINTGATQGGTSIVMDSQDLKRAWTEHEGCLVLSKTEVPIDSVTNANDITELFKRSFVRSNLHEPIELVVDRDNKKISKKVHHVGLLSVIDSKKNFGNGSFIEDAKEYFITAFPITGTVFNGYIQEKNDFKVTVYTFYKVDGLPGRLEKGLHEEYKEYMERTNNVQFEKAQISSIEQEKTETIKYDLSEMGLGEFLTDINNEDEKKDVKNEESVEDLLKGLDLSKL